jgi:hypothetical protein
MTSAALPLFGILFTIHTLGGEFRVNTYTTGTQSFPAVAAHADGSFVVAWRSVDANEDSVGIFGERFDGAGRPIGGPFHVNTYTTGSQSLPSVAADPTGLFVVAWNSDKEDGSSSGVFARLYDAAGAPSTAPFRVNTLTTLSQSAPSVAMDAAGRFVVAYYGRDGASYSIFARRYLSNGTSVGDEFRVNSTGSAGSIGPAVAVDASGAFVVAFSRNVSASAGYDVFTRKFTPDGAPLGIEFGVNVATTGFQGSTGIAASPGAGFVVTWAEGLSGHKARVYAASGHALTADLVLSTTSSSGDAPSVLALPDGGFIAVFDGYTAAPSDTTEILLRRYDALGTPLGSELRVNTHTTGRQFDVRIAGHPGGFVVVWAGSDDGSGYGVFGQRFSTLPVPGDVDGDGDADVADVFYLINFLFAGGPAPVG